MEGIKTLEAYLNGNITKERAIEKLRKLMAGSDDYAKYACVARCIKAYDYDQNLDFCGHLRQVLEYYGCSIKLSKNAFYIVNAHKNDFGFFTLGNEYEVNIRKEIASEYDELRSFFEFEKRKVSPNSISNGPVYRYFGYETFTSLRQKLMMYLITTMGKNETLLACIPTGGGKSFSWEFSSIANIMTGTIIVVVPTKALVINHENSAKRFYDGVIGIRGIPMGYHSDLGYERKNQIFEMIKTGDLPLLFVSPEALLAKEFKSNVIEAARCGRISALIIDEAHLVVSWGMKFRPEFQLLSSFKKELEKESLAPIKTILLSATITDHDREIIKKLFDTGSFVEYRADELRQEIEYYSTECIDENERKQKLKPLVYQAPRPMIIYTSTPEKANGYAALIKGWGFSNVTTFTGETGNSERISIIHKWNNDDIDIIVATSAFGMGVDKGDVRTVITLYIPESVSRYYQEVGRAGRDGYTALNYWLFCWSEDEGIVKNMTDTALLTESRLADRWEAMLRTSKRISPNQVIIPMNSVPEDMRGTTAGKQSANWNKDAILFLFRAGLIDIKDISIKDSYQYYLTVELNDIAALENKDILAKKIMRYRDWERASISDGVASVKEFIKYRNEECYSMFFNREFSNTVESCCGCPACRKNNDGKKYFEADIKVGGMTERRIKGRVFHDNYFSQIVSTRDSVAVMYPEDITEDKISSLVEFFVRYGATFLIKSKWDSKVLNYILDIDRSDYLLLNFEEFESLNTYWIEGTIVIFLEDDRNSTDKIYKRMSSLKTKKDVRIVYVTKTGTIIESESKKIIECVNYNTSLESLLEGEEL